MISALVFVSTLLMIHRNSRKTSNQQPGIPISLWRDWSISGVNALSINWSSVTLLCYFLLGAFRFGKETSPAYGFQIFLVGVMVSYQRKLDERIYQWVLYFIALCIEKHKLTKNDLLRNVLRNKQRLLIKESFGQEPQVVTCNEINLLGNVGLLFRFVLFHETN